MIDELNFDNCTGCSACVQACPVNCITMEINEEGFLYPCIKDISKCIKCSKCTKVCQIGTTPQFEQYENKEVYVCQSKNLQVRKMATSGGIYSVIAEKFSQDGVVFGAIMDENLSCRHEGSDAVSIRKFAGSKYVQSDINGVYAKIKELLKQGNKVCFSGTPCQVWGLKIFLGREYDNLYLVDLLCHGVPSPGIFEEYKALLKKKYKKNRIVDFVFRSKIRGYRNSAVEVTFSDGSKYISGIECDQYLRAFFMDLNLRKSCYNCKFRSDSRVGDITLFDCWHLSEYTSELDDEWGVTSVMINTKKGRELIKLVSDIVITKKVNAETCLKLDGDMTYRIIDEPLMRKEFFYEYQTYGLESTLNKYVPIRLKNILKRYAKNLLYKKKKRKIYEII